MARASSRDSLRGIRELQPGLGHRGGDQPITVRRRRHVEEDVLLHRNLLDGSVAGMADCGRPLHQPGDGRQLDAIAAIVDGILAGATEPAPGAKADPRRRGCLLPSKRSCTTEVQRDPMVPGWVHPRLAVRQADIVGEDVLVVDDAVRRRERVDVARVGPDRVRIVALVDRQPAVVAVEPALVAVGWREDGRNDLEVIRRLRAGAAGQDVVGVARPVPALQAVGSPPDGCRRKPPGGVAFSPGIRCVR